MPSPLRTTTRALAFAAACAAAPVARPATTPIGQVYPAPWVVQPDEDLYIGDTLLGILQINDGDSLSARRSLLAVDPGVVGRLELQDPGSALYLAYGLVAAIQGDASVEVRDGALLSSSAGSLGVEAGSSATVTIDGTHSRWLMPGDLTIGGLGEGAVHVTNGGRLEADQITLADRYDPAAGDPPTASGLLRVAGTGSTLVFTDPLTVGANGPGRLEVTSGAALDGSSGGSMTIGASVFAPSSALFVGTDTTVQVTGLTLAVGGAGSLDLAGGASLTTGAVRAGLHATGLAQITLDGVGTAWQTTQSVRLGETGGAQVLVRGSATLTTSDALLAQETGANARVTVTGAGTAWAINRRASTGLKDPGAAGELVVGPRGTGALIIADQAVVTAQANAYFGIDLQRAWGHRGGRGALHLAGGTLIANSVLVSPDDLTGVGQVQAGGWVLDGAWSAASLADLPTQQQVHDANGLAIGVQLAWSSDSDLFGAGYLGSGRATLTDGFALQTGHGIIGYGGASDGWVTLRGAQTAWDVGRLSVGNRGIGVMSVQDAAAVTFRSVVLGEYPDAQGHLLITGQASRMAPATSGGWLVVGEEGLGNLLVQANGELQSGDATIAAQTGSIGQVTLSDGSSWSATGAIVVGDRGAGTLALDAGSTVRGNLTLGPTQAGHGTLTLRGGAQAPGQFRVYASNATILVEGGAHAQWNDVELGNTAQWVEPDDHDPQADPPPIDVPAHTHLTVRGAESRVSADDLRIGHWEHADALIEQGASLTANAAYLGVHEGALGGATISGAGAVFGVQQLATIGERGRGVLAVQDGASVTARGIRIGWNPTASGYLDAAGPGTTVTVDHAIESRYGADSGLRIAGGAKVYAPAATRLINTLDPTHSAALAMDQGELFTGALLANAAKITGTGTIHADSMVLDGDWVFDASTPLPTTVRINQQPGQDIAVLLDWADPETVFGAGSGADGSVLLRHGADLRHGVGYIGLAAGGHGSVVVQDQRSRWRIDDRLYVGYGGTGTLTLKDSGVVVADQLHAGTYPSGDASVVVDGAGSVLDLKRLARLGTRGRGVLTVRDGGLVLVNNGIETGQEPGATGIIRITGTHATLQAQAAVIGDQGHGELHVADGGVAYLGDTELAYDGRGSAIMTVTGAGSFVQTHDLLVSRHGSGELTLDGGAAVQTLGVARIGGFYFPARPSLARVSGPGTTWDTRALYVGEGHLLVSDAARLQSENAYIGVWSNATARATLQGEQTAWAIENNLVVGHMNRPARLEVLQDAAVTVAGDLQVTGQGELVLGVSAGAAPAMTVWGDSAFDGGLDVRLNPNTIPDDQSVTIVLETVGTTAGAFDGLNPGDLLGVQFGVAMRLVTDAGDGNDLAVAVEYVRPGDLDGSGVIDQQDLGLLIANWGQAVQPGDWSLGDVNNDGQVGIADLDLTLSHWDAQGSPPNAIPEPAGLFYLGLALAAYAHRRRRAPAGPRERKTWPRA
ncbi:MAG: hypothetical protein ACE37H_00625 [Phycisphaeraceae bacterium]